MISTDWWVKIRCVLLVASQECVCKHLKGKDCQRCDLLNEIRKHWPEEYVDGIHAHVRNQW